MVKAVTITDVAVKAGVSVSTASKALCGKGRMSDDTRARIVEVAKLLGYKPNRAAQALSRKAVTIAAVLPNSPQEVQSLLKQGLCESLEQYVAFNINYKVYPYTESPTHVEAKEILRSLPGTIDALIFQGDSTLADELNRLSPMIPLVTLVTDADRFNTVTSVVINAETVGRLAAQCMALAGAKHTVIMAGREKTYVHERNIAGYKEAAEQFGVSLDHIYYTSDSWETAAAYTEELFRDYPETQGIFVSSYLAPSVCGKLKEMKMADRVTVIGVDLYDKIVDCLKDGSLKATIYQNQHLQAKEAVDSVMECISTGVRILPPIRVKPELVMLSNLECYYKQI